MPCAVLLQCYVRKLLVGPSAKTFAKRGRWWTGEDSNLRSPLGAADLQSAGFSHSPTRPDKHSGHKNRIPSGEFINAKRARVCRHQPLPFDCEENDPQKNQKFPAFESQLAEGFEPPTL
jgi:hypothetical protein